MDGSFFLRWLSACASSEMPSSFRKSSMLESPAQGAQETTLTEKARVHKRAAAKRALVQHYVYPAENAGMGNRRLQKC